MRRFSSGVVGAQVSLVSLLTLLSGAVQAQTAAPAPSPQPPAAPPPAAAPATPAPAAAAPAAPAPGSPLAPVAPAQPQPVPPSPAVAPSAQPVLPAAPPVQPQPAQPIQPQPVQPAPVQPAPVQPQPAPVQPAPEAQPSQGAASAGAEVSTESTVGSINLQPPPVDATPEAAPTAEVPWYQKVNASAFVDAYASLNASMPRPQDRNRFRAFDYTNGFSLAWAGLDLQIPGDNVGGTLNLRFGPSAARLAGGDSSAGLQYVKQAYATWRPGGADSVVTLDLGKFDTIYGAEVADSQLNFNYTRGLLYWLAQPAFHTGLRANFAIVDEFWITALVANGWNNSLDNNAAKSFGIQFNAAVPSKTEGAPPLFDAHLGYIMGPESQDWSEFPGYCPAGEGFDPSISDCAAPAAGDPSYPNLVRRDAGDANSALRHLVDLVLAAHPIPELALSLNADVGFEKVRDSALLFEPIEQLPPFTDQLWWGVSLAGRYQIASEWAAALRAEILGDPDGRTSVGDDVYVQGVQDLILNSFTLTGEYAPAEALLFRLDARLDTANKDVFPGATRSYSGTQFTTTLGAVVTTN